VNEKNANKIPPGEMATSQARRRAMPKVRPGNRRPVLLRIPPYEGTRKIPAAQDAPTTKGAEMNKRYKITADGLKTPIVLHAINEDEAWAAACKGYRRLTGKILLNGKVTKILEEKEKDARIAKLEAFVQAFVANFEPCPHCNEGTDEGTDDTCYTCQGTGMRIVSMGVLYVELPQMAEELLNGQRKEIK